MEAVRGSDSYVQQAVDLFPKQRPNLIDVSDV